MKTTLAILLLAVTAFAGTTRPAIEKAIAAAEDKYVQAMLHQDGATLTKLLGDDLLYTHSSNKTETKADVLKVMETKSLTYKEITFSNVHMRQYGNTVIVSHNAKIVTEQTGEANLYVTHVWVKQNGGWQLVQRQATKIPPAS